MDTEPTITLHYVRKDGKRERTKFAHHTLSEARELAQWVLNVGNGFYTEVDICNLDGTIERIQNLLCLLKLGRHEVRIVSISNRFCGPVVPQRNILGRSGWIDVTVRRVTDSRQ